MTNIDRIERAANKLVTQGWPELGEALLDWVPSSTKQIDRMVVESEAAARLLTQGANS